MSNQPCSQCGERVQTTGVTVRVYVKRRQTDYRYHLCQHDMTILETLLEGPAEATQRTFFDHRWWTYSTVLPLAQDGDDFDASATPPAR